MEDGYSNEVGTYTTVLSIYGKPKVNCCGNEVEKVVSKGR